ncbi:ran-binding protein 1-like protein c-like [Iris pallida]|uniref:Ran-binding protein 1-like protein c-like n=1 Tax=Iris pallida TaxID=29817 RepID=A0AAX6IBG4_IRIPA|nr:ran-binding protein 1-like protein c-like [Iris pallida]
MPIKSVSCSRHISGNKELHRNKGAVNMGGMCSGRVCYLFWFYLYNFQYLMFKTYRNYIHWLDMFVVSQALDVCGWTCVRSLWCIDNI